MSRRDYAGALKHRSAQDAAVLRLRRSLLGPAMTQKVRLEDRLHRKSPFGGALRTSRPGPPRPCGESLCPLFPASSCRQSGPPPIHGSSPSMAAAASQWPVGNGRRPGSGRSALGYQGGFLPAR